MWKIFPETLVLGALNIDPSSLEELIVIADDAECQRILADVGLPTVPETPPFTKVTTRFKWRGYHGMAFYEYAHSNPADNGYTVMLLPPIIDDESVTNLFDLICKLTEAPTTPVAA